VVGMIRSMENSDNQIILKGKDSLGEPDVDGKQ
jgi:hypothetical protein